MKVINYFLLKYAEKKVLMINIQPKKEHQQVSLLVIKKKSASSKIASSFVIPKSISISNKSEIKYHSLYLFVFFL